MTPTSPISGVNSVPTSVTCDSKKIDAERYAGVNTTGMNRKSSSVRPATYEIIDHSTRLRIVNSAVETTMPMRAVASDAATAASPRLASTKPSSSATVCTIASSAHANSNAASRYSPTFSAVVSIHSYDVDMSGRVRSAIVTSRIASHNSSAMPTSRTPRTVAP